MIEAQVDCTDPAELSAQRIAGLRQRLTQWLPGVAHRQPAVGQLDPAADVPDRRELVACLLEQAMVELQSLVGMNAGFSRVRKSSEEGVYQIAMQYQEEAVGRACAEAAVELCQAALADVPYDVAGKIEHLRQVACQSAPDASTAAILDSAKARDIPVRRLEGGMVQLGHGSRQRRILATRSDRTPAVAEAACGNRELLDTLLRSVGVPVADDPPPVGVRHRLLVVAGRVVAAVRCELAAANGDGQAHPVFVDVTDLVHAEVGARAVDAARAVGLDVAEIELLAADVGRPLEGQRGAVTGVVAAPALDAYLHPASGKAQPVGEAIVSALFPDDQTGRIPIVTITGTNGKTTTTRLIAHIISVSGRFVGMTCTDGIFLGNRRIDGGDCSGPQSARTVLLNPQVEAAVLETARGGILRAGLGFDFCDVAVVTNIGEGDHLGIGGIDTPEQLADVKQTLVTAVSPKGTAVLKADDPLVAGMAPRCPGSVLLFARDGNHPLMLQQRAQGGRVAFVRDQAIVLAEGDAEFALLSLDRIPLTHQGRVGFQIENALASAAATWALGVPAEAIRAGLESFRATVDKIPGRFNLMEINGAIAIFDYGHNTSSLLALTEAIRQFPHQRRLAVYTAAGDRRDADMFRQGEILGENFDRVILYEDHYMRGRPAGEIMGMFRRGMAASKRIAEVHEIRGWLNAVEAALWLVQPGELLLIQADVIDETVDFVRRYLAADAANHEIGLNEVLEVPVAIAAVAAAAAAAPVEATSR